MKKQMSIKAIAAKIEKHRHDDLFEILDWLVPALDGRAFDDVAKHLNEQRNFQGVPYYEQV